MLAITPHSVSHLVPPLIAVAAPAQHLHYLSDACLSCGCLLFVFWYRLLARPPRFCCPRFSLLPSFGVCASTSWFTLHRRDLVWPLCVARTFSLSCVPIGFSGSSRLFEILWVEEDKYIDAHRVRG